MNDLMVVDVGRDALILLVYLSAPLLLTALFIGVIISIFQAATQINEMTLTFIPKVSVVIVLLIYLLPTMLHLFRDFFNRTLSMIPLILP